MKKLRFLILLCAMLPMMHIVQAQESETKTTQPKGIQWSGEDEAANAMVWRGAGHMMNIEFAKSLTFFEAAVEQDKTLFAPHVVIAMFSKGEKRAAHKTKAEELVKGKNEASRLFVALLNAEDGKAGDSKRAEIWAKMHKVAPNGRLIHFYYALTRENPEDRIQELEKLAAKNEKESRGTSYIHNILGYTYYGQGNKDKAKMHFDKYLELYPDGYNPYDSMGEYYFKENDLEKALSYYKKATEKFSGAVNAMAKVKEIEGMLSNEGNLILVDVEHVIPEYMNDYWKWGEEYKAFADKTGYETFWVSSSEGTFGYASMAGKTMADLEAHEKGWHDWIAANPELQEMYKKYHHSVSHTVREVWRHSPEMSYRPKDYTAPDKPAYVRAFQGYVKFGHEEGVKEMLAEFKKEWEAKGISQPYAVFWNVFGKEGACVAIRSVYKDVEAWSASRKEVDEKIGQEKMMDYMTRWSKHLRHWEDAESFPVPALTHFKGTPVETAPASASTND